MQTPFLALALALLSFGPSLSAQYIVAGAYGPWDNHYVYPAGQTDLYVTGLYGSDSIDVDINADGISDVRFVLWYAVQSSFSHQQTVFIRPLGNCEVAYLRTDSCFTQDSVPVFVSADKYAEPLVAGTTIDNTETWFNDMQYLQRDFKNLQYPIGTMGTWCQDGTVDTTPVYLGVRFYAPMALYGWIKVSVWRVGQMPYFTLRIHELAAQVSPVGIAENGSSAISLYPNPTQGVFTLNTADQTGTLTITDIAGRIIHCSSVTGSTTSIDLSANPPGVYYLCFTSAPGEFRQPLIISR